MRKTLAALVLAALCGTASAAEITLTEREGYKPVVEIKGYIEDGDFEVFETVIGKHRRGIAVLDSRGGQANASLRIGQTLAARGFQTYIRPHRECLSSCAVIWIVGKERYAGSKAKIGFHGVFNGKTKERREVVNNWIKHTYLPLARLSPEVGDYITKAGPDEMTWLTLKDAKRLGISLHYGKEPDWKAPN